MNDTSLLVKSLKQDIYFLSKLIEDISKNSDINFSSPKYWHYFLNCGNILKQTASYEDCLEALIDRLYVIISLFLQCTNYSKSKIRDSSWITKPRKISLGLSVKLLWDSIMCIMSNNKEATAKTAGVSGNQDKETQTDNISTNLCDSCNSAITCMKKLLKCLNSQEDRLKIKCQIFDITQFGCMLQVTSSIEESLSNLFTRINRKESEIKTSIEEIEKLKRELQKKMYKIAFLLEEVDVLKKNNAKDAEEIFALKQEQINLNEELKEKNQKMNALKDTLNNFGVCFNSMTKEANTFKNKNNLLKWNLNESIRLLKCFKTITENKLARLNEECDIIKTFLEQYNTTITHLNAKLCKITKNVSKTELKLNNSFEINRFISEDMIKSKKSFMEIKKGFIEKLYKKSEENNKSSDENIITLKGNPLEDISIQIQRNRTSIQALESENARLQKLLDRFKCVQNMK